MSSVAKQNGLDVPVPLHILERLVVLADHDRNVVVRVVGYQIPPHVLLGLLGQRTLTRVGVLEVLDELFGFPHVVFQLD